MAVIRRGSSCLAYLEFIRGIAIQGISDFTCLDHFNHFIRMESIRIVYIIFVYTCLYFYRRLRSSLICLDLRQIVRANLRSPQACYGDADRRYTVKITKVHEAAKHVGVPSQPLSNVNLFSEYSSLCIGLQV